MHWGRWAHKLLRTVSPIVTSVPTVHICGHSISCIIKPMISKFSAHFLFFVCFYCIYAKKRCLHNCIAHGKQRDNISCNYPMNWTISVYYISDVNDSISFHLLFNSSHNHNTIEVHCTVDNMNNKKMGTRAVVRAVHRAVYFDHESPTGPIFHSA